MSARGGHSGDRQMKGTPAGNIRHALMHHRPPPPLHNAMSGMPLRKRTYCRREKGLTTQVSKDLIISVFCDHLRELAPHAHHNQPNSAYCTWNLLRDCISHHSSRREEARKTAGHSSLEGAHGTCVLRLSSYSRTWQDGRIAPYR